MSGKVKHIYDPPGAFADVTTWKDYLRELISSSGDHSEEIARVKAIISTKENA